MHQKLVTFPSAALLTFENQSTHALEIQLIERMHIEFSYICTICNTL